MLAWFGFPSVPPFCYRPAPSQQTSALRNRKLVPP